MLQSKVLWRLAAAAGLWLTASAALAAPQDAPATVPVGQVALPPEAYVAFCQRRPGDCGPDAAEVLKGARQALAERRALLAPVAPSAATAAVDASEPRLTKAVWAAETLLPAQEPLSAVVEAAAPPKPVAFVRPGEAADVPAGAPALTPALWAELNRTNTRVNRAIVQRTDNQIYLRDDFWTTPLQDGLAVGDCEDFVLEKRRALIGAGVPREALNIAVVVTREGDTHAVLLVNTRRGEFVLDNLSPWILPWAQAPYRWRQRQVNGEAFDWAMAAPDTAPAPPGRRGRLSLAALR